METKGSDSVEIKASPERVYNLLIDLSRIGETSPGFTSAEWLDGATAPHASAKFRVQTTGGASEDCRVLRAMPGDEWAFKEDVASDTPTTWRYAFKRTPDGCMVKLSWDAPAGADQVAGAATSSLANLKQLAEH
jgi:hypothetical protein